MATAKQPKPKLTRARLLEVLECDPATGICRWRGDHPNRPAGEIAGTTTVHGYVVIGIDRKLYRRARLMWLYVHGCWPPYELDHRDMVRHHDWISNLRLADQTQNNANRRAYRNNKCGHKGIYLCNGRYRAMIRKDGRSKHIGVYDTPEEAHAAYVAKARELFGDFARPH